MKLLRMCWCRVKSRERLQADIGIILEWSAVSSIILKANRKAILKMQKSEHNQLTNRTMVSVIVVRKVVVL